ncbi:hypothetical protein B0H14DRAFT_793551 [Mycena olivaceomarginata]|nr:hypothetical protein B0H14DRAFT_793551 [Mycena olivaceomarginata]
MGQLRCSTHSLNLSASRAGVPHLLITLSASKAAVYPTSTPHHSWLSVPLRPFSPHPHPRIALPQRMYTHQDGRPMRRAAGSASPDYGYTRGGSLSPELVGRGGSMSPEQHVPGRGHTSMTEDELVWGPTDVAEHDSTTLTGTPLESTRRPPARGALMPAEELKTFHCERVRKMPVPGLDPSTLIGFVYRGEADWVDSRGRGAELSRTKFSIQDEP